MSNLFAVLVAGAASLLTFGQTARAAGATAAEEVTAVLVHGAFAESSIWDEVIPKLAAHGYGPAAADVSPRIGHLHITVDDLPWHWLDASGEPLSINGLPAGPHKILLELKSPTHKVIDSQSVRLEIPTVQPTSSHAAH